MKYYLFFFQTKRRNYKDLREYILEMNKRHCKRVSQLGGNGDAVYDSLDHKTEEIWRRVHSDPTPPEGPVDLDLAQDPHAMTQSDEGIREDLLARAERSNDASLSRLVQAL